jgi:hypothetical protein
MREPPEHPNHARSDHVRFLHDGTFHAATSIMVLEFSASREELAAFFCSALRHPGSVKIYLCRPQSFVLGFRTDLPRAAVHQAGRQ